MSNTATSNNNNANSNTNPVNNNMNNNLGVNSSNNNATSNADSKKEEYRRYLEKTGVLDALTKVLVGLYEEPERPTNAIDYIKRYMGAPVNVDIEGLKRSNDALRHENDQLKRQIDDIRQKQLSSSQQQQQQQQQAQKNAPAHKPSGPNAAT